MKKILCIILVLLMILPTIYAEAELDILRVDHDVVSENDYMMLVLSTTYYTTNGFEVDYKTVEATVIVHKKNDSYESYKVVIEKENEYIYNMVSEVEYFPLQMGEGSYNINILGSDDNRRFKLLSNQSFKVEMDENAVFLNTSQTVNWDETTEVSILAQALTLDAETDLEKLEAIHTYIVNNVKYDYRKAEDLPKGYIPNAEETLEERTGICYDFSALLASMMRSVDVPTKLVKGYSTYTPVYHAWNEVLIGEQWYVVDSSTDSIFVDYNVKYKLNKSTDDYENSKVY